MLTLIYFNTEYAIKVNQKIIEISGGITGVKNYGNIDSPCFIFKTMIITPPSKKN